MSDDVSKLIKVPQILGAALSANIFVLFALNVLSGDVSINSRSAIVAVIVFAWCLRDFFDDMKAYESEYSDGFSLAPTVIFRLLSYMALATAIAKITDPIYALKAVSLYFLILSVWSFNSFRRRRKALGGIENQSRLRRRQGWLVLYPICSVTSFLMWSLNSISFTVIGALIIMIIYLVDVQDCETFKTKINETL